METVGSSCAAIAAVVSMVATNSPAIALFIDTSRAGRCIIDARTDHVDGRVCRGRSPALVRYNHRSASRASHLTERYRSGRNGGASKASCPVRGTWVRIPPSPPINLLNKIRNLSKSTLPNDMLLGRTSEGQSQAEEVARLPEYNQEPRCRDGDVCGTPGKRSSRRHGKIRSIRQHLPPLS